jgi:O-Antigen ligase
MMEDATPSFPIYVTLPVSAAILLLALVQVWRLRDACVTFLLLATWFRYSIATFHQYTYPPVVLGLSLMALSSIVVIAVGLVVVGRRGLLLRRLLPVYVIILVILISAAANQSWIGAINATFKWLYLVVFAVAAYHAMQRRGSDRVFRAFAVLFLGPIGLQWLSVPWGLKTTSADGWSFYIGGYQHQQALSIILITFLYVTCFSPSIGLLAAGMRLVIVAVGLALANYRTAVLAAGLPMASLVISKALGKVVPQQRNIAVVLLAGVAVLVFAGIASLAQERFADIGTTLDKGALLIKPPGHFTMEDKRLFSGRLFLWSQYIDAYLGGDIINILVGFGPESWAERFTHYAHNTFVSYLYELGIFGLAAFVWILVANALLATRVGDGRWILVSCHIGFVVLNLSTMPIWTLEGSILYALLLSQTWYLQTRSREASAAGGFKGRHALESMRQCTRPATLRRGI